MSEDAQPNMDLLQQENQRLANENKLLQGRIRGYKTLGDLLQEKRAKCTELERQVESLQNKLSTTDLAPASPASLSATPAVRDSTLPAETGALISGNATSTPPAVTSSPLMTAAPVDDVSTAAEEDLFSGPEDGAAPVRTSNIMQESMTGVGSPPAEVKDEDETVVIRSPPDSSSISASSSLQASPGASPQMNVRSESMETGLGSDRVFPTLSSVESYQVVLRSSAPREEAVAGHVDLMSMVEPELGALISASSPEEFSRVAEHLKAASSDIMRLGQENKKYKRYFDTVNKENRSLKAELNHSKEENQRLLMRIKKLEHERDNLPASESFSSSHDWVYLERNQMQQKSQPGSGDVAVRGEVTQLQSKIRSLEATNKKLLAANQEWQGKWTGLEQQIQASHSALIQQLEEAKRELARLRDQGDESRSELEDMLLQAKSRSGELEANLDDKTEELDATNARLQSLEERYNATQQQLAALSRENSSFKTELEVLQTRRPGKTASSKSVDELKTEIIVLRQQLKVFQEDFERERADRAQAQAACDDFKTQVDMLKREKSDLGQKVRAQSTELRGKEAALRQSQQQTSKLQARVKLLSSQLKEAQARYPVPYPAAPMYHPPVYMGGPGHFPGYAGVMGAMVGQPPPMPSGLTSQQTPELLHGSWTCMSCTYVNYPGRTICEMCGTDNTARLQHGHSELTLKNTANTHLISRSQTRNGPPTELPSSAQPDLVCDSMEQ